MKEVLRQEKKYLMNVLDTYKMMNRLEQIMLQDPHNGAEGYRIRSLYFDTPFDQDFYEKVEGLHLRKKIRLRCYGPDSDFAMLEMKQKEGVYQKKRSLRMKRDDAQELIRGNFIVLQKYREDFAAECYGLMCRDVYRPKTIVEYQRKAFIGKENKIRITLDSKITATECSFDIFSRNLAMYPVLDPFQAVLEVKYNGFLLSYIKNIVNSAKRAEISVSKYCLARSAGIPYSI